MLPTSQAGIYRISAAGVYNDAFAFPTGTGAPVSPSGWHVQGSDGLLYGTIGSTTFADNTYSGYIYTFDLGLRR